MIRSSGFDDLYLKVLPDCVALSDPSFDSLMLYYCGVS